MKNIITKQIELFNGVIEEVIIIKNNDGSEISMPKSVYDEMIAAQELNQPTL